MSGLPDPDPQSKRKTPILLRPSMLTEGLTVYALFDYRVDGDAVVAKTGGKEDVTQQFLQVAAKKWPHLVEEGYIEKVDEEDTE